MRYLVHRGTGTILGVNDDLVIVDIDDSNLDIDEADILELADKAISNYKAVIGTLYELPLILTDEAISSELNDYAYNWSEFEIVEADNDPYVYCLNNPDTWPLIRDAIIEDNALWNEYADTWSNAIHTVATDHRYRNEVAE
jgi:hypothetical protein